jgi:hypothetical protein
MSVFDFDRIDEWAPRLSHVLRDLVPASLRANLASSQFKWFDDALGTIVQRVDRQLLINATRAWLIDQAIAGYHGSRLSPEEIASVFEHGLLALNPFNRVKQLKARLSQHPNWLSANSRFEASVSDHADGAFGRRQGQAHLTLSRGGLLQSFNHYLVEGSEFDQAVAVDLLGIDARALLQAGRSPILFEVHVPGRMALDVSERWLLAGETSGLVRHTLEFWAYWLHDPTLDPVSQHLDSGLMFYETIPSVWIHSATPVHEESLAEHYRR